MTQSSLWMRQMFDSASRRYAISNKVLTFGQDEKWRRAALDAIKPETDAKILDICTGTADLALKIAGRFPHLTVHALDYSKNMLAVARKKADEKGIKNIVFAEGDVADTGFESGHFDYITVSFGFRNLSWSQENLNKALKEIHRLLKKGGRFIIIETSQPQNFFIKKLFHFYAANIVPRLGRFISKEDMPYKYLGNSIVKFFSGEELIDTLESNGFKKEWAKEFLAGAILLCVLSRL